MKNRLVLADVNMRDVIHMLSELSEIDVAVGHQRPHERKRHERHGHVEREQQRERGGGEQRGVADFHHLGREKLSRRLDIAGAALDHRGRQPAGRGVGG